MEKKGFSFRIKEDISTLEIFFSGELKGVEDFERDDFVKLAKKIKDDAESKIVYLNLNDVKFWDTEGMRHTLVLARDTNLRLRDSRIAIIASREGYLYRRATEKYKDIVDKSVEWRTSRKDDL